WRAQASRYHCACSRAVVMVREGEASQPSPMRAARSMDTRALAPIQYSTGSAGRGSTPAGSMTERPREGGAPPPRRRLTMSERAREQALDDVEGLLEGGRPLLEIGAHGEELRLAVALAALEDETAARDGGERADLLGDQHGIPEREEEEATRGAVRPFRKHAAEHRHILIVRSRRGVMIAHEERVQARAGGGRRALDHPSRALARVRHGMTARQGD